MLPTPRWWQVYVAGRGLPDRHTLLAERFCDDPPSTEFKRFLGLWPEKVAPDKSLVFRRLFYDPAYLRLLARPDWGGVPNSLRAWAGSILLEAKDRGVPLVVYPHIEPLPSFRFRLELAIVHARYGAMLSPPEWAWLGQLAVFALPKGFECLPGSERGRWRLSGVEHPHPKPLERVELMPQPLFRSQR